MTQDEAADLISPADLHRLGPSVWADLGCGTGTFTIALADALAPGSTIHAVDSDASALKRIPTSRGGVRIETHRRDFTRPPWPFRDLNGVIMANSLHYIEHQADFIRQCEAHMTPERRFVIVEYDLARPSHWVPYPVAYSALVKLFHEAGYRSIERLGSRPSIYQRAPIYAALVATPRLAQPR